MKSPNQRFRSRLLIPATIVVLCALAALFVMLARLTPDPKNRLSTLENVLQKKFRGKILDRVEKYNLDMHSIEEAVRDFTVAYDRLPLVMTNATGELDNAQLMAVLAGATNIGGPSAQNRPE